MNGRGFTPGPWSTLTRNNNDAMVTFHGVVIGGTFVDIPTENEQADARLIAAAPDLLAALRAIDGAAEYMDFDPDSRFGEALTLAQSAIAKATGAHS